MQVHHLIPASLFDGIKPKRPSSAQRGYGGPWKRARAAFLSANSHCLYCLAVGRMNPAECVDHSPPNRGDPTKFWDVATWMPSCEHHNNYHAAAHDGAFGNPVRKRPPAPLRASIVIPGDGFVILGRTRSDDDGKEGGTDGQQ